MPSSGFLGHQAHKWCDTYLGKIHLHFKKKNIFLFWTSKLAQWLRMISAFFAAMAVLELRDTPASVSHVN